MPDNENKSGEKDVAEEPKAGHDKPSPRLTKFFACLVCCAIFLILAPLFWALMEWAIH